MILPYLNLRSFSFNSFGKLILTMASPLDVLGLNHNATLSDVRRRYRQLALQHHPDKNGGSESHERFVAIQNAYEVLIQTIPESKVSEFQGPFLHSRWELWHEEEDSPGFQYMVDLISHLRFDAQDLFILHNECLSQLRVQERSGYEGYTRWIGQIISNVEEDAGVLLRRCIKIKGSECEGTATWSNSKEQVRVLQYDTVLRLNSTSLMFADLRTIQADVQGKGKLRDSEWKMVIEKLRELAHL